jgi:hypothetical protein
MKLLRVMRIMMIALVLLAGLTAASFAQGGPGRGAGRGQGGCWRLAFDASMDSSELIAGKLAAAIDDEYHARALYNAALDQFGDVRPFSNIVEAEQRHIDMLTKLYEKYGLELPEDSYPDADFTFASPVDAAEAALDAEQANAALYDELLADVADTDVITVFENLQWASRERHLPALENFLDNGGVCPGPGRGRGNGRGGGRGAGRGGCWRN